MHLGDLIGDDIRGTVFLEIPFRENLEIPKEILDFAEKNEVYIRDVKGNIYSNQKLTQIGFDRLICKD